MSLIDQLANPYVANIPGAIFGGMQMAAVQQNQEAAKQKAALENRLQAINITKGLQTINSNENKAAIDTIKTSIYDVAAAFALQGEDRKKYLDTLSKKYKDMNRADLAANVEKIKKLPEPQQDEKLLEGIKFGQKLGFIPVGKNEEKPTEQKLVESMGIFPGDPRYAEKILEIMKSRSSSVNIDMGKVPPGLRYDEKTDSFHKIKGGPQSDKQIEKEQSLVANQSAMAVKTYEVTNLIDKAMGEVNSFTAGPIGGVLTWAGGTPPANLAETLKSINSNLALDKIAEMKAMSPSGATGLGRTTNVEFMALQDSIRSLKQNQSPTQLRENLAEIKRHYNRINLLMNDYTAMQLGQYEGPDYTGLKPAQIIESLDRRAIDKEEQTKREKAAKVNSGNTSSGYSVPGIDNNPGAITTEMPNNLGMQPLPSTGAMPPDPRQNIQAPAGLDQVVLDAPGYGKVTEKQIQATMAANGMTRDQVIQYLMKAQR